MTKIPTPEELGSGHYFLQSINTPTGLTIVRIALLAIAVIFVAAYIYIRIKKDKDK